VPVSVGTRKGTVWVLDRQGITAHETGVRFSWWKAVDQLQDMIGKFVSCKPVEQADNSVSLVPLTGAAKEVALQAIKTIEAGDSPEPPSDDDGQEDVF
jgi:hypothetical protein